MFNEFYDIGKESRFSLGSVLNSIDVQLLAADILVANIGLLPRIGLTTHVDFLYVTPQRDRSQPHNQSNSRKAMKHLYHSTFSSKLSLFSAFCWNLFLNSYHPYRQVNASLSPQPRNHAASRARPSSSSSSSSKYLYDKSALFVVLHPRNLLKSINSHSLVIFTTLVCPIIRTTDQSFFFPFFFERFFTCISFKVFIVIWVSFFPIFP